MVSAPSATAGDSWTARTVLLRTWNTFRAQPLRLFSALVVLPALWSLPADLLFRRLVPDQTRMAAGFAGLLPVLAMALWASVAAGGQLLIALDVVRGGSVSWRRFLEGSRYTVSFTVAGLTTVLPMLLISEVPDGPWLEVLVLPLFLAAILSTLLLIVRTALWTPLIVDQRAPLWRALAVSWSDTREHSWKILRLALLASVSFAPLVVVEQALLGASWLSCGFLTGVACLTAAELYVLVCGRPRLRDVG